MSVEMPGQAADRPLPKQRGTVSQMPGGVMHQLRPQMEQILRDRIEGRMRMGQVPEGSETDFTLAQEYALAQQRAKHKPDYGAALVQRALQTLPKQDVFVNQKVEQALADFDANPDNETNTNKGKMREQVEKQATAAANLEFSRITTETILEAFHGTRREPPNIWGGGMPMLGQAGAFDAE